MKELMTEEQNLMNPIEFASSLGYTILKEDETRLELILQDASLSILNGTENEYFETDLDCFSAYIGGNFNL